MSSSAKSEVQPYIFFPGTCEEAINFYVPIFGADPPEFRRFRGSPMEEHAGKGNEDKIMHCVMKAGGITILASDTLSLPKDAKPTRGTVFSAMSLNIPKDADAARIFEKLSEGGEVEVPYKPTFWGGKFAQFTDKFGVLWMISCGEEEEGGEEEEPAHKKQKTDEDN
eukprot:comp24566_c0_seq1/m.46780 comp24566_c0_seq1/g.46780  ORF comp24566_c0_seq1/g.46780 comp24566_c0_seq1/m.46780 type:complete len:167 (-) comp24566_c0_seq1:92-592(-)